MDEDEADLLNSAMPAITQLSSPAPVEAPLTSDDVARRFVAESIAAHPGKVVLFALSWCEFCWSVRKLLDRIGTPFASIDLDAPTFRAAHDVPKIRAALKEVTGAATIPQVFVGGRWIGGCTEVMEAAESGELQGLLAQNSIACGFNGPLSRYDFLPNWVQPQPKAA